MHVILNSIDAQRGLSNYHRSKNPSLPSSQKTEHRAILPDTCSRLLSATEPQLIASRGTDNDALMLDPSKWRYVFALWKFPRVHTKHKDNPFGGFISSLKIKLENSKISGAGSYISNQNVRHNLATSTPLASHFSGSLTSSFFGVFVTGYY